jgi:DNA primase
VITQRSKEQITDAARIDEVIGDFITLKRRGSSLLGLCPFHNEKSPSFNVSVARNSFICFGCGKSGDPLQFIIEHEGVSFPEALRYLAKKYNIEVEETAVSKELVEEKLLTDSLYLVNEFARDYYQSQLFDTEKGRNIGLSYFKERGFREETIRKFGLGYAPEGRDKFTSHALGKMYDADILSKLGLTSQHGNDFFRNRVMFPIFNLGGKVIAFGGRIMVNDVKAPKYINSPETEIYHKSKGLYGIFQARKAIQKLDECILVEGYTDVISLHQAGIENVVSSSGTALTIDQIRMIKRLSPTIKIIYDGDAAGIKAALRGMDMVLEEDMNVKIVLLPNKEDPDSYVQRVGLTAFQAFIDEQAKDFILFKADLLMRDAGDDPVKKTALIKDMIQSIAKIPDPIKRGIYIRNCANLMGVEEGVLIGETKKLIVKAYENKQRTGTPRDSSQQMPRGGGGGFDGDDSPPSDNEDAVVETLLSRSELSRPSLGSHEYQERDIARILVMHGSQLFDADSNVRVSSYIIDNIEDVLVHFQSKKYLLVVEETKKQISLGVFPETKYFQSHSNADIRTFTAEVIMPPHQYADWESRGIFLDTQPKPELNFVKESMMSVNRLKFKKVERMVELHKEKIKRGADSQDNTDEMKLLKMQMKLIELRNQFAKISNTTVL